jgi:hypothetical protein
MFVFLCGGRWKEGGDVVVSLLLGARGRRKRGLLGGEEGGRDRFWGAWREERAYGMVDAWVAYKAGSTS